MDVTWLDDDYLKLPWLVFQGGLYRGLGGCGVRHDDADRDIGAHDVPQGNTEALRVTLLKPRAGEVVLDADHKHAVVGQLEWNGVLEPRLETRRVQLASDDS